MNSHRLLLLFLLFLLPGLGFAQTTKTLRGFVADSLSKTPLESCTVVLNGKGDSARALTNAKGQYLFSVETDTVIVTVSFSGYRSVRKTIIGEKQRIDTILLAPADKLLENVVVKARVPPVVVRGDTTEFNIDSSLFEPFDAVEDLVKRLPGLERTEDGGLRFQGKPIDRILVDGENLFDANGDFAMKKIPAGMVAKIQVMDTRTLEQLFAGVPADGEAKTLNIKLKAGNKRFGSLDATAGTRNQVSVGANASQFREAERMNMVAGYSSSNRSGLFKNSGGPVSAAQNAGLNYGNKWGRLRIDGGYSFFRNENASDSYRQRTQLITADTSFFTKMANRFAGQTASHRANLSANVWTDSSSTLDMTLAYAKGSNTTNSVASSATSENGLLRNESQSRSASSGTNENWGATLSFRKWLNRKGRTLSINARLNSSQDQSTVRSQSTNSYFKNGAALAGDTLDRRTLTDGNNQAYGLNIGYAEPLSKTLRISLNANLDANRSRSYRRQYDVDSLTQHEVLDTAFSASILSATQTRTLGTSLVHTGKKLYLSAGLTTLWQQVERSLQKQVLSQTLLRHSPSVNVSYNLADGKLLRMNFSAATQQPTLDQLQPVPDNSNPLYVRLGNPALRTAFAQNYALSYNQNSVRTSVSASLSYAPVSNQIVNAVTYDVFRRVTSQFVNIDGTFSARASLHASRRFGKEKKMTTLTLASNASTGEQAYFQTGSHYVLRAESLFGSLSLAENRQAVRAPGYDVSFSVARNRSYTPANLSVLNTARLTLGSALSGSCTVGPVYAATGYRLTYNRLQYRSASRRDDEFLLHALEGSIRPAAQKKTYVQLNFSYQYNTQVAEGTPRGQFNSNLSATAQFFKDRGRAVVTVYDLFATRNRIQRVATENYIEDIQSPVLRNYVTLRVQYSFSSLQKK